jgi:hypothetical protein
LADPAITASAIGISSYSEAAGQREQKQNYAIAPLPINRLESLEKDS